MMHTSTRKHAMTRWMKNAAIRLTRAGSGRVWGSLKTCGRHMWKFVPASGPEVAAVWAAAWMTSEIAIFLVQHGGIVLAAAAATAG